MATEAKILIRCSEDLKRRLHQEARRRRNEQSSFVSLNKLCIEYLEVGLCQHDPSLPNDEDEVLRRPEQGGSRP